MVRYFFWCCGSLALALGIIGIFLPVLPTTPFVLLAAACWAKASPRFHRWLYRHHYFGPMVQNWQRNRAVPRRAKILAVGMMTLSCGFLFWHLDAWHIPAAVSICCAAVAVWMIRLPEA
ncbi:YbaN family protein [Neisseria animalis]|uniref:YbaN family protein n=1 Tax=Neisseria animalis TaxID=492 RepID=UPI0013BE8BDD|nr:YbaN family protein [Neisseria animalis]